MTQTLTIASVCFNQLDRTKSAWGSIIACTAEKKLIDVVVVDNGSTDGTPAWIERYVIPQFHGGVVLRNPSNLGVFVALNQAWRHTAADVIALLHNDLHLYEVGWDKRVMELFSDPNVGLAGFVGAKETAVDGGRDNVWGNMLEQDLHGQRTGGVVEVANLDGLALICARKMLEAAAGFDETYPGHHHFYDKEISMASLNTGFRNYVLGIACHHEGGITAATVLGDGDAHQRNAEYFRKKWQNRLPVRVA